MENEMDFGFEEFESALFDDGYQTGDDADMDDSSESEATDTQETDHEDESKPDSEENSEDENNHDSEENGAEDGSEGDGGNTDASETFTLKVNKEEKQVSREDMIALAQKGMDYDRVKEQNTKHQQTISELQSQLEGYASKQTALDILETIAQKTGSNMEQLAESLYVNFRKNAGTSEDAAREELKSAKLEKELNGYKAAKEQEKQQEQPDAQERAQRDLEEFGREYPEVSLTDELIGKLAPDIRAGMSLTAAYRKYERAQSAARIAELEQQLAAKTKNAENRKRSPGSQQDSGGRRTKTEYEEFEKALFG